MISKKTEKVISNKEPEKGLLVSLQQRAGRGNSGRITVRHKGGGVKKLYRMVDFGQAKKDVVGKVLAIEYDPYRTAFIMLLEYEGKERFYQLAPHGMRAGDEIICSDGGDIKMGNRMRIKNIPIGALVYNVELYPDGGGKIVRSAGAGARVLAHEGNYANLQMPSGEVRRVFQNCFASIGSVSHPEKKYEQIGKAGTSRLMGIRPGVRGKVMNPCDHPHGGGEGNTPIGLPAPRTPWGKLARGGKTRRKSWTNKMIISRRVKKS